MLQYFVGIILTVVVVLILLAGLGYLTMWFLNSPVIVGLIVIAIIYYFVTRDTNDRYRT